MSGRVWRAGLLAVVTIALLGYGASSLARAWQMQRAVERLERDIVTLRGEAGRLSTAIDQLRNDPDTLERLARESVGLVKPGERVFKLPPTPGG